MKVLTEYGRGFAVVADEVRTLSRRTSDSTGEIRNAVLLQRDEIGRVGRRSQALGDNADQLVESVTASREVSEASRSIH